MGGVLLGRGGGRVFSQWGRRGKTSVQTFSSRLFKKLTEGDVTTEAGSLFQYFTTLTENADPFRRRWLAPWSTLYNNQSLFSSLSEVKQDSDAY